MASPFGNVVETDGTPPELVTTTPLFAVGKPVIVLAALE
jgi:hypothetical protein